MDTSKKITSYEDACKVLNIQPINEEVFNAFPKEDQRRKKYVSLPQADCNNPRA